MTHKPDSRYEFVEWYRESIVETLTKLKDSQSAEVAKTVLVGAGSWVFGMGYFAGIIAEAGARSVISTTGKVAGSLATAASELFIVGIDDSGEPIKQRGGSFMAAIGAEQGISYNTSSSRWPHLATLSSVHFEAEFVTPTEDMTVLPGAE